MLAASMGMIKIVQMLLKAGANPDLQNQVWLKTLQYKDYLIYGPLKNISLVHG